MRRIFLGITFLLLVFCSCKYFTPNHAVARDTTVTPANSFNPVFLDSATVDSFLAKHPEFADFTTQFRNFYHQRNYEYAWFDTTGLAEQAHNFLNLQNSYITDFSDSSFYNKLLEELFEDMHIRKAKPSMGEPKVLQAELLLTGQFFRYAAKVFKGSDLDARQLGWYIPKKKINLTALLDSSLKTAQAEGAQFVIVNPQYHKLQEQLGKYLALEKQYPKDSITPLKKPLKTGDTAYRITQIKQRLQLLGDMPAGNTSHLFDSSLTAAVKIFQQRMGLATDGVIGSRMIAELNVSLSDRIRQILVNIERVRWMPAERGSNFVLVNIPEFKLHVIDSGRQVMEMNVIVGKAANNTVIFTSNLKYVVFSPYWNVPPSITRNEILPAIRRNSHYLARNNMEITSYSGGLPEIRQRPGPTNALGLVKFLFPNNYNIYLHDTPNKELFSMANRSFSHGCIRISEPRKFAEYLLRDDPSWTSEKIDSAMHLSKEKWVNINKPIPVYVVYFTAWVDAEGKLNFRNDLYKHDEKMAEKLFVK